MIHEASPWRISVLNAAMQIASRALARMGNAAHLHREWARLVEIMRAPNQRSIKEGATIGPSVERKRSASPFFLV